MINELKVGDRVTYSLENHVMTGSIVRCDPYEGDHLRFMPDAKKTMFLVTGHNGCSGHIEYPEDFETVGIFPTKEGAQAKVDELNREVLRSFNEEHSPDDPIDDIDDIYDVSHGMIVMIYDMEEVDVFG